MKRDFIRLRKNLDRLKLSANGDETPIHKNSEMMNIGIIGSGEMGRCLASKFVSLGHAVSMANSRGPASLREIAEDIGVHATTVGEVIKNKQVIVVSIPTKNVPDLPFNLFRQLSQEVVVIDTGNYYPTLRDGAIPALDAHGIDSVWVQEQLGVSIVKVFNSILATSINDLGNSHTERNRVAMAVSGDQARAKEVVFKLVDELGFDSFDVGDIKQSWKQQPGSSIYCRDISVHEMKKRVDAMERPWSEMRDIILAKRKANEALMRSDYPAYLKALRH
jgi:8-hydroxy-5-deazaflavin:NADPH oxidoreductase